MTKEALKMALEALEGVLDDAPKVLDASIAGGLYEVVQCRDAITAIKEALAQPVQEPVAWKWRVKNFCDWPNWSVSLKRPADSGHAQYPRTEGYEDIPLYTTPPQRTWVGLTEDEAFACKGRDYFETYRAIETKLRNKTT
jgi:hypothetical protein